MGHARAVATAPDPEALAREIIDKGLSVRQAEALARREKPGSGVRGTAGATRPAGASTTDPDIAALERQLGDLLGLKVRVAANGSAGTVTLHFSNLDQLDLVCQRLSGEPI
jgi:ParB family chromosome partitioning protein